jgi:hypothetical protein
MTLPRKLGRLTIPGGPSFSLGFDAIIGITVHLNIHKVTNIALIYRIDFVDHTNTGKALKYEKRQQRLAQP